MPSGVVCNDVEDVEGPMLDVGAEVGLFREDGLLTADAGVTVQGIEVLRG